MCQKDVLGQRLEESTEKNKDTKPAILGESLWKKLKKKKAVDNGSIMHPYQ